MAVGTHTGIREGDRVTVLIRAVLNHWRHLFQIDLVHDAVTSRNHVHILERGAGPVNEVKTVFVATVFDGAVLLEGIRVETRGFNGQGMVNNQLGLNHRVDLGGITALLGNSIAQAGQVHQGGLAQDVMAHHPRRVPGEIQVAAALNQLLEGIGQGLRIATAHQLLRQNLGGIRQLGVGARLDVFHRLARIVVFQFRARQGFTVLGIHSLSQLRLSMGNQSWCSGPVYSALGRIIRLLARCSFTWAVQPDTRDITKMGVNNSVGMPMK